MASGTFKLPGGSKIERARKAAYFVVVGGAARGEWVDA